METLKSAALRTYKPKQYSEKEKDLATLVLRIGGPRLVDACAQMGIVPSKSLIYKVIQLVFNEKFNLKESY